MGSKELQAWIFIFGTALFGTNGFAHPEMDRNVGNDNEIIFSRLLPGKARNRILDLVVISKHGRVAGKSAISQEEPIPKTWGISKPIQYRRPRSDKQIIPSEPQPVSASKR